MPIREVLHKTPFGLVVAQRSALCPFAAFPAANPITIFPVSTPLPRRFVESRFSLLSSFSTETVTRLPAWF